MANVKDYANVCHITDARCPPALKILKKVKKPRSLYCVQETGLFIIRKKDMSLQQIDQHIYEAEQESDQRAQTDDSIELCLHRRQD